MRSVPGGLRRLLRDRGRLIAVVLLATVALSASGIQSAAAVALHRTLDSNWRGAYDVLVTAKGTVPGAAGMIAPNALSSADQRMTLADVAKIRSVAGIDVAAPIGEVVVSGLALGNPTIALPQGVVDASMVPQAFQVTTTYSTNDGLGPRYVTSKTSNFVIDETPRPPIPPPSSCNLNGFDVDVVKYPLLCIGFGSGQQNYIVTVQEGSGWGAGETVTDGVIHFQTYDAPQGSTRITLVDPVAERKLLGDGANFLRPLISLSPSLKTSTARMTEWAQASDNAYAKNFLDYQEALDSNFSSYTDTESAKQFRAFEQEHGVGPDQASGPPPVYVPLLTANAGAAALTVSTTVRALGPAPRAASPQASFPYELPPAGASSTPSLGRSWIILCGFTSSSRASSLIRILLILKILLTRLSRTRSIRQPRPACAG